MKGALHISDSLSLPLELAARTTAILAQKGAGKTYAALRITEELLAHGQQVVALDPTGVWWGLRAPASASPSHGAKGGVSYPVIVLGGEHADAPLEPTAGAIVARFAVESGRSLVLDMSGFESNAAQDRFATDFATALYRLKATQRATLHLMVDEADSFAPQRPMPGQQAMLGAFEAIVRRGRSRGLGMTLISQRPAVLNKNVLSQADLLIALRVVGVHDHKSLSEFASMYGTPSQRDEFLRSLPQLKTGEAWFWSPSWLGIFAQAKVSRRVTFDSSRTPEPGEKRETPAMGAVDLADLSAEISQSAERAKANDPKLLQRRVRDLEKQLAEKPAAEPERVEVPVLDAKTMARLEKIVADLHPMMADLHREFETAMTAIRRARPSGENPARVLEDGDAPWCESCRSWHPIPRDSAHHVALKCFGPYPPRKRSAFPSALPDRGPLLTGQSSAPVRGNVQRSTESEGSLGKCERAILTVLKQYAPQPVEKTRVALIAGYASNGGGFNNSLGSLRTRGCIEAGDPVRISASGERAIGDVPPLPTGRELLEYWQRELGGASAKVLAALQERGGHANKQLVATLAGYEVSGGGFNNALGKLRTLKLITGSRELSLAEDLL